MSGRRWKKIHEKYITHIVYEELTCLKRQLNHGFIAAARLLPLHTPATGYKELIVVCLFIVVASCAQPFMYLGGSDHYQVSNPMRWEPW